MVLPFLTFILTVSLPFNILTEFLFNLIDQNETEVFICYLSLINQVPLKEIDAYIDRSVEKQAVAITSYLNEYRNKIYSADNFFEMQILLIL